MLSSSGGVVVFSSGIYSILRFPSLSNSPISQATDVPNFLISLTISSHVAFQGIADET